MNKSVRDRYRKIYTEAPVADIGEDFDYYKRNKLLKKMYQNGKGKNILDLGAGAGALSRFFMELGYETTAIEWTESSVEKLLNLGINTLVHDVEDIPYPINDNSFNEVFWGDNIEHLFDPEKTAREVFRILCPGGRLILSTPNHGWIINRFYFALNGVPRKTEGHNSEIWNWLHIRYFNKKEIVRFLKKCGFKNIKVSGTDQRKIFAAMSKYYPSLFSSVMVVEAYKD